VFWRSKENNVMNIERDDLGTRNDTFVNAAGKTVASGEDAEYWYLRAIKPGEYNVSVFMYSCLDVGRSIYDSERRNVAPMPIEIKLIKLNPKSKIKEVRTMYIDTIWKEYPAFNFVLDASGETTSINQIPVSFIHAGGEVTDPAIP
jgi:hypothetical protein